jgi:hypothetical protein
MPEIIPTTLDYATPTARLSRTRTILQFLPLGCWAVALSLSLALIFEIFGSLHSTSGSTDPQIRALNWAWSAIAIRSAIALLRRQRSWWSLAYIVLIFVLSIIADMTANWWWSHLAVARSF